MAKNNAGAISQVTGAVVDVKFEGDLPYILSALVVENKGKRLILEVRKPPTPVRPSACQLALARWVAS